MELQQKLVLRSIFIFAITLGFVAFGTYLLFRYNTIELYNKKLHERANLAADYYLEKDELSEKRYKEIDKRYRKITNETIRLYHFDTKTVYVNDSLDFVISKNRLQAIAKHGTQTFTENGRQFLGLFYKDNEGDFIIIASGIDTIGRQQLMTLRWMLGAFCAFGVSIHFFMTYLLAKRTFRPFASLIESVNAIRPNNLGMRLDVPPGRNNEQKKLINAFNYFLERIESSMGIQQHFLKHVSHELKTPLTVLIGDIEIALRQDRSNLKYKEILASLKNEALHLKSILDSLLMLSSLEIPENQQMKQLRVDEVLWDILDKKKIEYPETMVSIVFKSVEDLQQLLLVKGNRDLLFVAFSNLIDNAIKFSNSAPITVTAESVSQKLVISVIDKGIGMSPNEQVNIFKLFYRNSTHMNIGGHGIGLYLTKQILDMHHVDLHLDSVPGHGTTFKLSFPAQF